VVHCGRRGRRLRAQKAWKECRVAKRVARQNDVIVAMKGANVSDKKLHQRSQ
jgi:hypothetical protein